MRKLGLMATLVSVLALTACGSKSDENSADETATPTEVAAPAQTEEIRPSFDCSRARLPSELLVCQDSELARLDRDLASAFAAAKSIRLSAATLVASQRQWVAETLSQCADRDCVYQAYIERIEELEMMDPMGRNAEEYARYRSEVQNASDSQPALSEAERRQISKEACERRLESISFIDEMNYHSRQREPVRVLNYYYHTEHTHPNWKARYGDNYIHSYVTYTASRGRSTGEAQFKLCIVSRDTLEVLDLIDTDIVA